MTYLLLKWVHIISSTILFGTGIGSAFFMFMANRRRDVPGIAFAVRHVVIADWLFTTPAGLVQFITGAALVMVGGYAFSDFWVWAGLALYCFAGACWVPVVWMQMRMQKMAEISLRDGTPLPEQYWRMERLWVLLGSLAFPALVVVFYLMVAKPV